MSMIVSYLAQYLLKSAYRTELQSVTLDQRGIENDRKWMVVNEQWNFISQRNHPRLATVKAEIIHRPTWKDSLSLTRPDGLSIMFDPRSDQLEVATVWGVECLVYPELSGSDWLSEYLDIPCRLVRMAEDFERKVKPKYSDHGQLGFADGAPLLIASQASLADFNRHLQSVGVKPIPMTRFRPNIVIGGVE